MHLWVTTTCVGLLLAAPAAACPKPCLLKPPAIAAKPTTTPTVKPATTPAAKPPTTLRLLPKRTPTNVGSTSTLTTTSISDELEMPWIWRVLRERVYDRLPRYERRKVTFVFSPVVVASPSDTVPGLGVGGDF